MKTLWFKQKILGIFGRLSKAGKMELCLSYLHNRHRWPDLKNPHDLSEIWIKRILDGKVNENYWLADKYAVRKYVEDKRLEYTLTRLIGTYTSPDEINFKILPQRFALKANFGAGMNIICTDKSKLDEEEVKETMKGWLRKRTYSFSERHYNLIEKRIVCEEFIDDGTGGFPVDYKFMCIKGRVACILGVGGREEGHGAYLPYTIDWQPRYDYYRGNSTASKLLPRPANLEEMVTVAEKLAEGIDLVRVDLYSNGSRIWFGEMTLTPAGCIFHRWTQSALDDMGELYRKD